MKKTIYLTLTFIMMLSLVACDNNTKNSNTNNDNSNQITDKDNTETNKQTYTGEITEDVLRSQRETSISDFEYERSLNYDGIKITRYLGSDDIVVIPKEIEGQPVAEVATLVFGNDSQVRGVVIPNTVTRINEGVFANNKKVEMVIADGLQEIGESAFLNCKSLHTIILSDYVTVIEDSAFGNCFELKEIHLPTPLVNPDEDDLYMAFTGCLKLTIYGEKDSILESIANELEIPFIAE